MPRERVDLKHHVERLSILDEKGHLDEELEPDVDDERLLKMHRTMLLARRFDAQLLSWQREGRIGTFAPVQGQEAAQVGAMAPLDPEDWFVPAFRETAAALWRGTPMSALILYNAGFNEGAEIPEGAHDLPIAIPVASQILHAVGIAYGIRYRKQKQLAITFFGDGATSEGDFHEGLNFAAVFKTPTIFLCQNNQWAISIPRKEQTRSRTLAQKALAYAMPGVQVDGNDVLAVYAAVAEAAERARAGKGPTMIEAVTYRLGVHTTADDPSKYRDEKEVEKWQKRDPIPRFQRYLIDKELLSEDEIEELEDELDEEIQEAWNEAQQRIEELGDPLDMFDHVYQELPPYLREQRDGLKASLNGGEDSDG